jgi:hypothetical protein
MIPARGVSLVSLAEWTAQDIMTEMRTRIDELKRSPVSLLETRTTLISEIEVLSQALNSIVGYLRT